MLQGWNRLDIRLRSREQSGSICEHSGSMLGSESSPGELWEHSGSTPEALREHAGSIWEHSGSNQGAFGGHWEHSRSTL